MSIGLKFIQSQGVKLVSIGGEDIADGSVKLTLGLLWVLILKYQISTVDAGTAYFFKKYCSVIWDRNLIIL